MITYTEKGFGLHQAIAAAGHTLYQDATGWVSSDDSEVQVIIDSYTLAQTQAAIKSQIDAYAATLRDRATAGISAGEMASWTIKRNEATAYTASSNAADAPMLNVEATARGIALSTVVSKVQANANGYSQLEAIICGISGKHKDAIGATLDFASALAYDWSGGWPVV
jgi:hypothetical protein